MMTALAGYYYSYSYFKPEAVSVVQNLPNPFDLKQEDAVIYQIYLRSFQDSDGDGEGDIKGLIERLPYLSELGVDTIWVLPAQASITDHELENLTKACEKQGLHVMVEPDEGTELEIGFEASEFQKNLKKPRFGLTHHTGVRHIARVSNSPEKARLEAMFLLTQKGNPVLYYGEEIGMTQELGWFHHSEGYTPMQWEPEPLAGFSTEKPWIGLSERVPSVYEQWQDYASLLWMYKKLIGLRKWDSSLRLGDLVVHEHNHPDLLLYSRHFGSKTMWVALNFGTQKIKLNHSAEPKVYLTTSLEESDGSELRAFEGIIWNY